MGREGKRWASPQGPHYAQTTQRRARVQDRQGLLRPRRARSAPRRYGLELLGAHDGETPALRFRRTSRVIRRITSRGERSPQHDRHSRASGNPRIFLKRLQTLRPPELLRLETLSRYVFRSLRGQIQEDGGVLLRGYAGGGVLFRVGGGAHLGAHPARVDGVHADLALCELGGQDLGEPLYPELAHRVGAPLGPSLDADSADHVDHGAALGDVRDRRLRDQERPGKVGVYYVSPLVFGILYYPDSGTQETGVVDEHVYLAETLDRLIDHPLDVGAFRHVRREGQDLRPRIFDLFGDRTDGLFAAGVDRHPGALSRKGECERPAETLARAGDHYYLAFEH